MAEWCRALILRPEPRSIILCFLLAFASMAIVQSQFVYTPYVYSSYVPYYGWVWGSNKNGGADAPMPPPPSSNGGGPAPMGPSFTNNAPRL
uniref:Uncharacterized protein n=1 Tax=Panagrolaimus superbus TaxID=310955 RepID=A0A914Y7Q5_9BILA